MLITDILRRITMRMIAGFIFLVVSFLLSACSASSSGEISQSDAATTLRLTSNLLEIDFTGEIAGCDFVTASNPEGAVDQMEVALIRANERKVPEASKQSLTDKDLWRLGIWVLSDGKRVSLFDLQRQLAMYYSREGHMPSSGVDLFPDLAAVSQEETAEMTNEELLHHYAVGINPISGKFYSGFTSHQWTPGGYSVEIVADPGEIANRFPHLRVPEDPTDPESTLIAPESVWQVTVYGETEDSIILETISCVY